jgi:hypothetical protein
MTAFSSGSINALLLASVNPLSQHLIAAVLAVEITSGNLDMRRTTTVSRFSDPVATSTVRMAATTSASPECRFQLDW